jgi:hypothetical protein
MTFSISLRKIAVNCAASVQFLAIVMTGCLMLQFDNENDRFERGKSKLALPEPPPYGTIRCIFSRLKLREKATTYEIVVSERSNARGLCKLITNFLIFV